MMIFNASGEMLRIGVPAIKIISIHFLGTGFCVTSVAIYNSMGRSIFSLLLAIARQIVIVLPAAYILSIIGGVDMIWWAYPIAEIMAVGINILLLKYLFKHEIDPIPSKNDRFMESAMEASI